MPVDYKRLFELATPFLEKNDLGADHTQRVLDIAKNNFSIPKETEELTVCAIILHDIGGGSIKDQYEKGPARAESILRQMEASEDLISQVCSIVGSHHDHPETPSISFSILYDSDKLVMFSPQEFPIYNARLGFDWNKIIDLIYSNKGKQLAHELLEERKKELVKK